MTKDGRRFCYKTGKVKYFNEAWAKIAVIECREKYGIKVMPYKCRCGWWHLKDKTKYNRKESMRKKRRKKERKR